MNKLLTKIMATVAGFAMAIGVGVDAAKNYSSALAAGDSHTGTIVFGSASGSTNVNTSPKTGNDSLGNEWTVTTAGTTSFTPNSAYAQIGSSNKPASSITFTTSLDGEYTITAFSAKFGGFSGTAGTVSLKVGTTEVGTGSLNASNDVVVSSTNNTQKHSDLTVTVTGIAKGVKAYYISYTYEEDEDPSVTRYNVTFYPLNGEENSVQDVSEGGSINPLPSSPTKEKDTVNQIKYEFAGWYIVDDPNSPVFDEENKFTSSTKVYSDLNVCAKYNEINYYVVSFNSNGGSAVSSQEVNEGQKASLPQPNPTKDGYSFAGWYTENGTAFDFQTAAINEDITLYAHWNSISIEETGVFVKVTSNEQLVDGGKYLIVYNNQKVFNGFLETLDVTSNTVDASLQGSYIAKDNNTQKAYFTIDTTNGYIKSAQGYYIGRTADSNGFNSSLTTTYENTIEIEDENVVITSSHGAILRYNNASNQNRFRYYASSSAAGQQPIQLYRFTQTFTVSFNTNGGSEINDMIVLSGSTLVLPSNPTKAADANYSYTFEGWYTDSGLTTPFVSSTPITSNLTLYAKYTSEEIDSPSAYLDFASSLATIHARQSVSMQNRTHDIDFTSLDLKDSNQYLEPFEDADHKFTVTFAGGSNDGKYYNTGTAIRTYGDGTITIESESTIKAISFTWFDNQANKPSSSDVVNTGTYDVDSATWTGSTTSVVLTRPSGSGHWRLQAVEVTLYESVISVSDVCMRFGISISKDSWDSINTKFGISDYGVMLLRKTTLESQAYDGYDTVEAAFRGGKAVTNKNKGSGDAPYLYTSTNTYAFTLKLNVGEDYTTVVCAAPYIVAGGEYYFLEEKEYSAKTLAQHFLNNPLEECAVSNAGLRVIAGVN